MSVLLEHGAGYEGDSRGEGESVRDEEERMVMMATSGRSQGRRRGRKKTMMTERRESMHHV